MPSCNDPELHEALGRAVGVGVGAHELWNMLNARHLVDSWHWVQKLASQLPSWLATMMRLCSVGGCCGSISLAAGSSL